jgi:hypothetical protein
LPWLLRLIVKTSCVVVQRRPFKGGNWKQHSHQPSCSDLITLGRQARNSRACVQIVAKNISSDVHQLAKRMHETQHCNEQRLFDIFARSGIIMERFCIQQHNHKSGRITRLIQLWAFVLSPSWRFVFLKPYQCMLE